jgi:hypothetical protein
MVIPLLPAQKSQYISEMNAICRSLSIPFQFSDADWKNSLINTNWSYEDHPNNPLKKHLGSLMPDKKGATKSIYYRYFSPERLCDVLKTDNIQMSSMKSNYKNDDREYIEYFDILNSNINKVKVDSFRDSTYILCFSDSYTDKRIWKEYTNNEGVCIEAEITPLQSIDSWIWEFRSVFYGTGNEFAFLKSIIQHFKSTYNIDIVFPTHKFAQFFKRNTYSWENETRICIQEEDLSYWKVNFDNLFSHFPKKQQNHCWGIRNYIDVPLDNYLFNLSIKKVFLGPKFKTLCNLNLFRLLKRKCISYERSH